MRPYNEQRSLLFKPGAPSTFCYGLINVSNWKVREGRTRLYTTFFFFYSFVLLEIFSSCSDLTCVLLLQPTMPIWVWLLSSSVVLLTIVKNLSILNFCQTHLQSAKQDIFLSDGSFAYFFLKLSTFRLVSGVLFEQLPIFGVQYLIFEKIEMFKLIHMTNNFIYFIKNFTILLNLLVVVQYGTRKIFLMIYGEAFGVVTLTIIKILPFFLRTSEINETPECIYSRDEYNPFSAKCVTDYDWLFLACLAFLELHTFLLLFCLPPKQSTDVLC